jgi:hypothetical protein
MPGERTLHSHFWENLTSYKKGVLGKKKDVGTPENIHRVAVEYQDKNISRKYSYMTKTIKVM